MPEAHLGAIGDGLLAPSRIKMSRIHLSATLPTPKLGLFYLDDGRTLIVVDAVDARQLRQLP
jgi:hypothetical protein